MPVAEFTETHTFLYADQADLDPDVGSLDSPMDTLMLMYDECQRTVPLGPDEFTVVRFMTVDVEDDETEKLEQYVLHLFTDGTIIFYEDGELEGPGRTEEVEGMRGKVGFDTSPNCAFDHVISEFQVQLTPSGGAYSPDPLWWTSGPINPAACAGMTVTIQWNGRIAGTQNESTTESAPTAVNVGEEVTFTADVTGATPTSYLWTIDGTYIDDYDEDTNLGPPFEFTINPDEVTDLTQQSVSIFWRDTGIKKVLVTATAGSDTCSARVDINVERNALDIYRQAEDFYISQHPASTTGLPGPTVTLGLPLRNHQQWHVNNPFGNVAYDGSLFFDFHRAYLSMFGSWRDYFGYDCLSLQNPGTIAGYPVGCTIVAWVPGDPLPVTADVAHPTCPGGMTTVPGCNRIDPASYVPQPVPTWFLADGGNGGLPGDGGVAVRPDAQATLPCDDATGNEDELIDFPADRDRLGCAFTGPFHNGRHVAIGGGDPDMGGAQLSGDMSNDRYSPTTPIFWRWHTSVDDVSQNRIGLSHLTPPQVWYQAPFRLNYYITELPRVEPPIIVESTETPILVENTRIAYGQSALSTSTFGTLFQQMSHSGDDVGVEQLLVPAIAIFFTEEVAGVQASDLTVNGSPATSFMGSGAGPYVFTGFEEPGLGLVDVNLDPSHITDRYGNTLLSEGSSWSHILLDPEGDDDGDGMNNHFEANIFFSDPTNSDSDHDGMPDGFEGANPCLSPLPNVDFEDEAHTTDANGDADGDGISNIDEFEAGTDPCPPSPRPQGDNDVDGIPNEEDNCINLANPDQADTNFNGIGDACETPDLEHDTAVFLQALTDGSTTVEPRDTGVDEQPSFFEMILRIVQFRLDAGLTDSASDLTENLVDSLVDIGLVSPEEADDLVEAVLQEITIPIDIDIKPGSSPNTINLRSPGVIRVAILTTNNFDASEVDATTVKFGPAAAPAIMTSMHHVDGDRDNDMVLLFRIQATGIACGQTSATLTGETLADVPVAGTDTIKTLGC